jgi:hypothetical protein
VAPELPGTICGVPPYVGPPRSKQVYRITYPNGKIYIGMDLTGTALYFGSSSIKAEIAADLGPEVCRDLTIRKEILGINDSDRC